MMMTRGGQRFPRRKVFVMGVGVAALQAIVRPRAPARRRRSTDRVDVRPATKEVSSKVSGRQIPRG